MRRPDASMSLLTDLQEQALEPEYRDRASADRGRRTWRLGVVFTLVMALLTLAVLQTTRGAGVAQQQRDDLLERIAAAREEQASLSAKVSELDQEVRDLGEAALDDPRQRAELQSLELSVGAIAVRGPGVVVVVTDAPNANSAQSLVLDSDLRRLVNGLREAGAEAIAINGRRLTTLTPIRSAGAAITVDFVSLSPPYKVEAIGDPQSLQARFNETAAATWWQFIVQNYGLTMTINASRGDLTLPADPGMTLRYAEVE